MSEERRQAGLVRGACDVSADPGDVVLVEVDDQQQRLRGEELEAAQALEVVARELQPCLLYTSDAADE